MLETRAFRFTCQGCGKSLRRLASMTSASQKLQSAATARSAFVPPCKCGSRGSGQIVRLAGMNAARGGLARNRTGMEGFAVLCVTIPPRGLCRNEPRGSPPIQSIGFYRKTCFLGTEADGGGRGRLALCKGGAGLLYARREETRSLIAQLVEQSTVNRSVAGSSPAQGAS